MKSILGTHIGLGNQATIGAILKSSCDGLHSDDLGAQMNGAQIQLCNCRGYFEIKLL